jgi:beta-lactam-binding protein with PASTA domain
VLLLLVVAVGIAGCSSGSGASSQDTSGGSGVDTSGDSSTTNQVDVPDVTSQPGDQAKQALEQAGLTMTYSTEPSTPTACDVQDQTPAAGDSVDPGTDVTVTCGGEENVPSRGPSGANGTYNCADFDTQQEAQDYFDSHNGSRTNDPDGLDHNHDGVPCQNLP